MSKSYKLVALIYFSALGQACFDTYQCTLVDSNSECDIGTTDTCICIAGYVEELTFCKSEYIDQGVSNGLTI